MTKLCAVIVKGKTKTWSFNSYCDTKYLDEWRADGIDIDPIENIIPTWVVDLGLLKPWCFLQDLWNFKWLGKCFNMFKR